MRTLHVSSRQARIRDAGGRASRVVPQGASSWSVPVQGLASVGELLRRRRCLPRVSGRPADGRLTRLRPRPARTTRSGSTSTPRRARPSPCSGRSAMRRCSRPPRRSRSRSPLPAAAAACRRRRRRASSSSASAMPAAGSSGRAPSAGVTSCSRRGSRSTSRESLAKRLGVPTVRFVNEPLFSTLVSGRAGRLGSRARRDHDHAGARAAASTSPRPYLTADQAVLMRKWPRARADLDRGAALPPALQRASHDRRAARSSTGSSRRRSRGWSPNPSQLTYDLYNDRCDAIVFDAAVLGAARAAAPERYGPFAGGSSPASATGSPSRRAALCARA